MKCRGILFDLYGTLLVFGDMQEAWSDWLTTFRQQLTKAGYSVAHDRLAKSLNGFLEGPDPEECGRGRTVFERRVIRSCDSLGLALSDAQVAGLADAVVSAWHAHVSLDPQALSTLEHLGRTYRLGLVSNFDHDVHVRRVLQDTGLQRHFEAVVVSGEIGYKKPDPRIFDGALKTMDLESGAVAYVGDEESDLTAARAAGLRPVLIRRANARTGASPLDSDGETHTFANSAPIGADVLTVRDLKELVRVL